MIKKTVWNGQSPWIDEIIPWKDFNGKKCLSIMVDFNKPNDFFNTDWIELGYDSYEEFSEKVWQRLEIRFFVEDGTWETRHYWDDEHSIDSFPFSLTDEETEEVSKTVNTLKKSGELNQDRYKWE